MLKDHYETIIVGAGPAGLACALKLKELGAEDFVVLERFEFPRDKCCAGYITGKTRLVYESLGLNIEKCHYSFIEDFGIWYDGAERQKILNRFLYTNDRIDRVELDHAFFKLAREKGVAIEENARVSAVDLSSRTVTVNDSITVGFGSLVFADGTVGIGSKLQEAEDPRLGRKKNIAMQMIFESDRPDSIELHFGIAPKGYGWISSCGGVTNAGITDEFRRDADYHELFADYLRRTGFDPDALRATEDRAAAPDGKPQLHAAFTPIGLRKPVIGGCVYYAGDALGACDPFTLSGLRYGLKSGQLAAEAIVSGDARPLKSYVRGLKAKYGFSRFLMKLFYVRPITSLVLKVGCRWFGGIVSFTFNNFFINKK
ncbi:MAG: NAD(P)/FAD-dependent oxidoreductase [Firmicutes bacterium]|nr:NAD(P)/FAD-dependent oxidoreductase [Bacillota bacterium]